MFIEVSGLTKSYPVGGTRLTVLKSLDVSLERGEMLAIVGASGVGKSTLLHVLGGLDSVDEGTVRIDETVPERSVGSRSGHLQEPSRRLRVPVPPPAAGVQRTRERRDADADCPTQRGRSPRTCVGAARVESASRRGSNTVPGCCREGSSSASPSPALW